MLTLLLVACAPVMSGAPATPLPSGRTGEFGFAATGGLVATPSSSTTGVDQSGAIEGGLFLRLELQDGWGIVLRTDFGLPYGLSGGFGLRYGLVRTDGAYFGLQADLGFLYGGVSVPAAFRLHPSIWVWTRPGVVAGIISQASLPVGVTVEVGKGIALNGEVQLLTPVFERRFDRHQPTGATAAVSLSSRF